MSQRHQNRLNFVRDIFLDNRSEEYRIHKFLGIFFKMITFQENEKIFFRNFFKDEFVEEISSVFFK